MFHVYSPSRLPPQAKFLLTDPDPSQSPTTNLSFVSDSPPNSPLHESSGFIPKYQHQEQSHWALDEILERNKMLLNFCQNEEESIMSYPFMDHQNLLPFEVAYENDNLLLTHFKEMNFKKCKSLMGLLALKQENFVQSFVTARNLKTVMRENENLAINMFSCEEPKKKPQKNILKSHKSEKNKKKIAEKNSSISRKNIKKEKKGSAGFF